jgi:hypothetical protein
MTIETQTQDLIDAANDLTAAATGLQTVIVSQVNAARDAAQGYATASAASAANSAAAATAAVNFAFVSALITTPQANNTITPADLTGHVFSIPPNQTLTLIGRLIFTSAATNTGAFYGYSATHPAGADGNLIGSWFAEVNLSSAAAATSLTDGDAVDIAGGATLAAGVLGTASVAGNNSAMINLAFKNTSGNVTSTVSLQFRSETAGTAVTAQIGTNATGYFLE